MTSLGKEILVAVVAAAYLVLGIPKALHALKTEDYWLLWDVFRPLAWCSLVLFYIHVRSLQNDKSATKRQEDDSKTTPQSEAMESTTGCCGGGSGGAKNISSSDGCSQSQAPQEPSESCCQSKAAPTDGCCQSHGSSNNDGSCQSQGSSKNDGCCQSQPASSQDFAQIDPTDQTGIRILYATIKGTSQKFAEEIQQKLAVLNISSDLYPAAVYDPELLPQEKGLCIFVFPTYEDGTPPPSASWFYQWLVDTSNDFRVDQGLLSPLKFAVLGLGDSTYDANFLTVAKNIEESLLRLRAAQVCPLGKADCSGAGSVHGSQVADLHAWVNKDLVPNVQKWQQHPEQFVSVAPVEQAQDSEDSSDDESVNDDDDDDNSNGSDEKTQKKKASGLMDLEDMGEMVGKMNRERKRRMQEEAGGEKREMITPELRSALTKQGYKLIGSHSGVKLCRWTKSMLRGRGGCYKHTFYGIESHRCMETTPSLACANKCVFCWRHHTNPVGTEWKWKMDPPDKVINGAMQNHYDMIRQYKGAPGVLQERLREAYEIKHCALSLVGEPIMYPEINKFLEILHSRKISSFLVTNAQFPDAITNLTPVCQLYVSIDASTKDSLKKIDRPLFSDFWPRFMDSLKALGEKGQRTVYRLTMVKAWNDDEIQNYANLVSLGNPDFIEIKGVTFCGESKASSLTMGNVPWHEEVKQFVENFVALIPQYKIASEHEHSNCFLIAHEKFIVDNRWYTWIDYDRFHQLIAAGKPFKAEDYLAPTPEWAVYGSKERGFDPIETRHRRNKPLKNPFGC